MTLSLKGCEKPRGLLRFRAFIARVSQARNVVRGRRQHSGAGRPAGRPAASYAWTSMLLLLKLATVGRATCDAASI